MLEREAGAKVQAIYVITVSFCAVETTFTGKKYVASEVKECKYHL